MLDFSGKVVAVTGASTGLGRSIAVGAARAGARAVLVNYARSKDAAQQTAALVEAAGATARLVQADIAKDQAARRLADAAAEYARLDALFNNAAISVDARDFAAMDRLDAADFLNVYRTNVVGNYQVTRALLPLLRAAPGAAIVNTSSVGAVTAEGSSLPYILSKSALITMTQALARALAPEIRVNAILPGYMDTPWFDRLGADADRLRDMAQRITPLKMACTADDVAEAALFLASPAARTITGETLLSDAGLHLVRAAAAGTSKGRDE